MQILPQFDPGADLGKALGGGISKGFKSASDTAAISTALQGLGEGATVQDKMTAVMQLNIDPDTQKNILTYLGQVGTLQEKQQTAQTAADKVKKEDDQKAYDSQILSRYGAGEEVSQEDLSGLSPTSLRSIIGKEKAVFEPESAKLEAKRVAELATNIENEFKASRDEELRLGRMEKLSEKGEISTPAMVTAMDKIGLPLGVLGNPDTEEYAKLQADFLRDVRNVFPGGRITNYEIQAYLKTVPSLMNSKEGKKAIIRNRKLQNEAKKLRYDAYRDILKENKGQRPEGLSLMIEDRIGDKMVQIEEQFREGISSQSAKFQQSIRMVDPQGNPVDIPPGEIEAAMRAGARFK